MNIQEALRILDEMDAQLIHAKRRVFKEIADAIRTSQHNARQSALDEAASTVNYGKLGISLENLTQEFFRGRKSALDDILSLKQKQP